MFLPREITSTYIFQERQAENIIDDFGMNYETKMSQQNETIVVTAMIQYGLDMQATGWQRLETGGIGRTIGVLELVFQD
ncbi:unnamed protein product [Dovyalis caffra]|uniref:Uncharacterized protein n=1 Tax=Dovyalis caffra TaxID=77055 RepID=A0AAV1RIV5_9ROSI|nr:unnamed protein product [Dovyalis caffra]